jgi:hypothetical protein
LKKADLFRPKWVRSSAFFVLFDNILIVNQICLNNPFWLFCCYADDYVAVIVDLIIVYTTGSTRFNGLEIAFIENNVCNNDRLLRGSQALVHLFDVIIGVS